LCQSLLDDHRLCSLDKAGTLAADGRPSIISPVGTGRILLRAAQPERWRRPLTPVITGTRLDPGAAAAVLAAAVLAAAVLAAAVIGIPPASSAPRSITG